MAGEGIGGGAKLKRHYANKGIMTQPGRVSPSSCMWVYVSDFYNVQYCGIPCSSLVKMEIRSNKGEQLSAVIQS